jgi:hypothetical protein
MPLSQGELDAVRRSALIDAGRRAPRRVMRGGDGEMIRSVPFSAYHNAVAVHGESPRDEGYWRDMDRRYPEIVVKSARKTMVSMAGAAGKAIARAGGVLTRLGRATRYYYGG